ncbi:MAG: translation initiation factor IF-2 subunit gamma [Candidatus Nanoarchaeia archaeon]
MEIPTLNIGIVGHIDHGKTTLLYRLTEKWADTHSEELKKGITIKLGYANTTIKQEGNKLTTSSKSKGKPVKYVTFVDAPGHEMLMATMLSGAAIMDAAILVIAADEGIKPQTQEHLIALQARNIKDIIIVQNKIDAVSKEQALENYKKIQAFTKGTIAENAPIIPVSAQQNINLDTLIKEINKIQPKQKQEGKPLFLIARSFDINRPGTPIKELKGGILGGALKSGSLNKGDIIEIKPGRTYKKQNQTVYETIKTKIIAIYRGDKEIEQALPGGSLAIETELDPSLTKADALSGNLASLSGDMPEPTTDLKAKYQLFEKLAGTEKHETIQEIKPTEMLMISSNTSITVGHVKKAQKGILEANLKIPIVPIKDSSIGIARNIKGHWRLIGFGSII